MKKNFKFYVITWTVLFVLFNVITFFFGGLNVEKLRSVNFWIGYVFIMIALIGQLICSKKAFEADNAQKLFYRISLLRVSYIGLAVSFVIGALCMTIPALPYWIAVIICAIVLAFQVFSIAKATAAASEIERIDEKIKTQTFFIRSLTVDAATLMEQASSPAVRAECNKVYEAIRYSDPMSHDALASAETQITLKFEEFSEIVKTGNIESVTPAAKELVVLVENRNKKCMLLK